MKITKAIYLSLSLLLVLPLRAEQPGVVEPVEAGPATETLADDSIAAAVEEALLDELAEFADSLPSLDVAASGFGQTDADAMLLEWALSWLDTTLCVPAPPMAISDAEIQEKLWQLPTEIPMSYNEVVKRYIEMYLLRRPRQLAALQRAGDYYFPLFDDKLCQYGLPYELRYLPVIESALNASARSHAGAAGLWQFMPSTARLYGLEVNSLVDERLDPWKSTDAACRLLSSMYRLFGDWHLVLAAYNCGPGNVNKAMRRSGGKRDFWSIYPWLPRETRSYVPLFIAAVYSLYYAEDYGICRAPVGADGRFSHRDHILAMCTDTIHSSKRQHLMQSAAVLGLPIEELRGLNPSYLKDVMPGGKDYILVLPLNYAGAYVQYEDSVVAWQADSLLVRQKQAIDMAQQTLYDGTWTAGGVTWYKVKKGDTLSGIAKRFRCTVAQLQRWNGLKTTNLQINQKLKILK